jgi:hypothetical protein
MNREPRTAVHEAAKAVDKLDKLGSQLAAARQKLDSKFADKRELILGDLSQEARAIVDKYVGVKK